MRPAILFPLFTDIASLKGVGPNAIKALTRLLGSGAEQERTRPILRDLLMHLPSSVIDRREISTIADAGNLPIATLIVMVLKHYPSTRGRGKRSPYRVVCSDPTGTITLTFFNPKEDYLLRSLPEGESRLISGSIERYDGLLQMPHPDIIALPEHLTQVARLEPQYPLTYAMTQSMLRKFMAQALLRLPELPEWIDASLHKARGWSSWKASMRRLHLPENASDIARESLFFERLAYDEILANQLALAVIRSRNTGVAGIPIAPDSALQKQLIDALPFTLTGGQQQVLGDINTDLQSGQRMLRLLQGDVGSGKTVLSLLAMMPLIEAGYQAALMVPTEILGQQHLKTISNLIAPLGLKAAILTGKMPAKDRKATAEQIASGEIHIIIGTHALLQESVQFHRLGLVVIDEQHRFGVNQRLSLSSKGDNPHLLLMTATPIPRSLTMTAYGDMDSSLLREKPANRPKIDTRAIPLSRIDEVVDGLKRAITTGSKIYWICPLVEESEPDMKDVYSGDLAAAEERHRVFTKIFGERVGLAHGKMKPADRHAAMQGFAGNEYDILVATTVVEVGVDVRDATIIVIEHAERFGLAQLHQLRGRVGRGDKPSSCILLYSPKCSEVAKKRLGIIRESDDGFHIAEEDLILRGAGDVLGTRQSGMPDFRFIDLAIHRDLVLTARDDVKLLLHKDPTLQSERGQALRCLLYLFDYDSSLKLMQAG